MLSFICNYIIREVEAIYSNKSSRICSDRYTSEGILLNGFISLSFISSHSPHVQTFVSFSWFWGFAWEGALLSMASIAACAALAGATAPGLCRARSSPCSAWVALGALELELELWQLHRNMETGFVLSVTAGSGAAIGCAVLN